MMASILTPVQPQQQLTSRGSKFREGVALFDVVDCLTNALLFFRGLHPSSMSLFLSSCVSISFPFPLLIVFTPPISSSSSPKPVISIRRDLDIEPIPLRLDEPSKFVGGSR